MAKSEIVQIKETILTLTEEESRWLKGLLQNPPTEKESIKDLNIRQSIFEALQW